MIILQKHKAQKAAKTIRQQLYSRIYRKHNKMKHDFQSIPLETKKIITLSSALQLVQLMDQGKITSLEIVLTFIQRTIKIGVKKNYVLDEMFEEAIGMAKECDRVRKNNKGKKCWKFGDKFEQTFPPFFGVPISLKQVLLYKDRTTYIGHLYPLNPIPKDHSFFVQIILKMGFIPFVRSNVPPACKMIDTVNNIFGYCHNPWRDGRSCGGSSGGESGLIASGCSPFGIGTDIGGSGRVPCEWTGLCSLKHGFRYTRSGNCYYGRYLSGLQIKSQITPMTKSVEDLILYCQYIFDPSNYSEIPSFKKDIYIKQIPFDNSTFKKKSKLTIGYMENINGSYQCSSAHKRVLSQTVQILRDKGHTVKKIQIPELIKIFQYFLQCFTADQELFALEQMRKDEPPIKQYKLFYIMRSLPWLIKYLLITILKKKEPRFAKLLSLTRPINATDFIKDIYINSRKRQNQIYRYLAEQQVDVWLMPGFPLPAIQHGNVWKFNYILSNCSVWNALHYPAGAVPMSLVKKQQTSFQDGFNDMLTRNMRKQIKESQGLPVGVQVISYPSNDEQILYIMNQLQKQVKFRTKYVCPITTQQP